jgi:penicillin V acylase-like amidase (Ntn superfamily)
MRAYFFYSLKAILLLVMPGFALGCTGIRLKTQQGGTVYARTMVFGTNLKSSVLFIPRGYSFVGTDPLGEPKGLAWSARYAVLGANALGMVGCVDGINEKGLAGGLFALKETEYQKVAELDYKNSIAWYELLTWILTNCATIADVKKQLPSIYISGTPFKPLRMTVPVHAIVHDEAGDSVIIEYIGGALYILDNPSGAIANSSFLSAEKSGAVPQCTESSDRFDCARVLSAQAPLPQTERKAVDIALNLLVSKFYQPYLQWESACDIKNRRYYFYSPVGHSVVDFEELNPEATQQLISFSINSAVPNMIMHEVIL